MPLYLTVGQFGQGFGQHLG